MLTVDQLNVPPPRHGTDALIAQTKAAPKPRRTYRASVSAEPDQRGRVQVVLDGRTTTAKLRPTAKAVQVGDRVEVTKSGGTWHIVGSDTWHVPPEVSGSMGTRPPNATTVSGSTNIPPYPGVSPQASAPSNLSQALTWIANLRAYLHNQDPWNASMRGAIVSLNNRVTNLQSALNTNASRTNAVRDYAGNAGQLVEPVVDALRDERIVR